MTPRPPPIPLRLPILHHRQFRRSLPTTLVAPGRNRQPCSFNTVALTIPATIVDSRPSVGFLKINSNDPTLSTPTLTINLHGIGTPGQFGVLEPSLVQVLRAHNIPDHRWHAGPNDVKHQHARSTRPTPTPPARKSPCSGWWWQRRGNRSPLPRSPVSPPRRRRSAGSAITRRAIPATAPSCSTRRQDRRPDRRPDAP